MIVKTRYRAEFQRTKNGITEWCSRHPWRKDLKQVKIDYRNLRYRRHLYPYDGANGKYRIKREELIATIIHEGDINNV